MSSPRTARIGRLIVAETEEIRQSRIRCSAAGVFATLSLVLTILSPGLFYFAAALLTCCGYVYIRGTHRLLILCRWVTEQKRATNKQSFASGEAGRG